MKLTVVIFQTDSDRFSALGINIDQQRQIWKNTFYSRRDLISSLDRAGVVTEEEIRDLEEDWFEQGAPILQVSANREDIECVGFERALSGMPN